MNEPAQIENRKAPGAKTPFYTRLAMVLMSLFLIGYIAILAKELLAPLIIAMLFAILLLPLAGFFEKRWHFGRATASFTALFILLGGVVSSLYFIGHELSTMGQDWPTFKSQITQSVNDLQQWLHRDLHIDNKKQAGFLHDAADKLLSSSSAILGITVVSASSLLIFLVFIFIYCFFLLLYRAHLVKFLEEVFKEENKTKVHEILEQVQYIIRSYLTGVLLEMGLVALACCIAFWITGIKYALLLGIVVGIFNIIPYVGILTALILCTLITFATGASLSTVGIVALIVIGIHLIDSNFLLPVIVGAKVRINALMTIVGVVIGEMMWGIPGMFLSLPVVAIIKIVFDRIDALKPWGALLGDEEAPPPRKRKKRNKTIAPTG
ncbi:MAG: AI-2E family transporter [Flavihumibacter sp.]